MIKYDVDVSVVPMLSTFTMNKLYICNEIERHKKMKKKLLCYYLIDIFCRKISKGHNFVPICCILVTGLICANIEKLKVVKRNNISIICSVNFHYNLINIWENIHYIM